MRSASPEVLAVLEPIISSMGYEFVGAQYGQAESGLTLRVFIDVAPVSIASIDTAKSGAGLNDVEKGIVLDDCAAVSRQLSAVLDVEDVIEGAYALEVSSPGIDRPLFTAEQFTRFVGKQIRVKMNAMVLGRRKFKGELTAVEGQLALVEVDGEIYDLPIDDIESARLEVGP